MCDIISLSGQERKTFSPLCVGRHRNSSSIQSSAVVADTVVQRRLNGKIIDSSPNSQHLVEVRYPRTYRHEDKGKFTDYEVYIETNKIAFSRRTSCIRRRFSEFLWLRRQLASIEVNGLGKGNVPKLPPKRLVGRFDPPFLLTRQRGLEEFLKSVLKINKFLSYSGLHLFLQSPMTISEIEDFLVGKYGDKSVEDMLEDFGCAANTDNPFSILLRNEQRDYWINKSQRSQSHGQLPSITSNDGNFLSISSPESPDMSSGSFPGEFLSP